MGNEIIWIGLGVLTVCLASGISELRRDVCRINVTLDKIAKQMGVDDLVTGNIDTELKILIAKGKKIKAIKQYRMKTGIGLKEAKEYVDLLSEKLIK